MAVTGFAPAKVNLYLHVGPPRADGLHPIDSLIAFADVGDRIEAQPAETLTLAVTGPFAPALAGEADNLVLRAARLLAAHAGVAPRAALTLHKRLPIASGVGGGSSDAAAALRVLNRLWACGASLDDLEAIAAPLGSDVPGCVRARPARMRGVGELLEPAVIAPLNAVLVNPLVPAPTGAVYRAFDARPAPPLDDPGRAPDDGLIAWLRRRRNDLEGAAQTVAPAVGDVLDALRTHAPGALVRMSGSGATCFAVTDDAPALAAAVSRRHPQWWVRAARFGAPDAGGVDALAGDV
ncbi:MAG: 4-(cytidine 5'-diphospho)-2-C-methyl-D-erythritol kinase [Hyphomonadaceae bacterium]|nr:4-(cytidine 5'-diphospho)-2-C-methyl-D-erythritol kinase [Hyphomonadaceae bacterium]